MANWIDGRTDILDRQVRPKVLITEEIVAVKVITVVVVEVGKQESASSFDLHAVLNKGWACSAPLLAGLANARRVECGSAGRRLLPERHTRCASGALWRATSVRTAQLRKRQSRINILLIRAVLADVTLCGAPDAPLVCLPGGTLLPADPHSTLLEFATPGRRGALPKINCACSARRVVLGA